MFPYPTCGLKDLFAMSPSHYLWAGRNISIYPLDTPPYIYPTLYLI